MLLRTFSTRIALVAGALVLVGVVSLSWILIQANRTQVIDEMVHAGDSIADTIRLSIRQDMLEKSPNRIRQIIDSVAKNPGIEGIRLFNKEGQISYSSRPDEVGQIVDKRAEACYQCHDTSSPVRELSRDDRSRIYSNGSGGDLLATINVIPNEPGCSAVGCHQAPDKESVLGVLDVALPLIPVEERLMASDEERDPALYCRGGRDLVVSLRLRSPVAPTPDQDARCRHATRRCG